MEREELQQLSPEDFKMFFAETLAESRDLAKMYNDLFAKSLSVKVKEDKISRDKAEEVILAVIEYNKRVGAFLEQLDIPETILEMSPESSGDTGEVSFIPPTPIFPPPKR